MKPGQLDSKGRRYGLKQKSCAVCGDGFWPSNGIQKYCSSPCAYQGQTRTRNCEGCGESFTMRAGDRRRFCSPTCSNRSTAASRAEALRLERPKRECEECGDTFEVRRIGQRWCSQKCHGRSRRNQPRSRVPQWRSPRGFTLKAKGETACRNCGRQAHHLHHVVPRSKSLAGELDLRNGIPLCFDCHRGWHDRRVTIPLTRLNLDELLLVIELADPVWVERNYPIPTALEQAKMVDLFGSLDMAYEAMSQKLGPLFMEVSADPLPQGETLIRFAQAVLDAGGIETARRRTAPLVYRKEAA